MKQILILLCCLFFSIGTLRSNIILNPQPQQINESGNMIPTPVAFHVIGMENLTPNALRALLQCVDDRICPEGVPFRVGVRGDESIRKYKKMIPDRREGYYLTINTREVVVAGNDRRGLYYGLRTLEQLLEQAAKKDSIYEVEITDWPDVAVRGVVEGFYGQPWSHEARMKLIDFYSTHKLNTYIYGPKNDRYHSSPRWRQLYPKQEAEQLRCLVNYAHEKEVDFVWAIHPGRDIKWNDEDRDKLIAKLEGMYALGVRAFAVFFDDISGAGTEADKQVELLNYLNSHFIKVKGDVKPLIMCPTEYNRGRWKKETGYLKTLGEGLDADIQIMWTGERALSDITTDNLTWVQTLIKRKPYIWWNFPVTDYSNDRIMMGEVYGLDASIATEASAFVANPMEYAEASKLAIYSVANRTWNIRSYDSCSSWKNGIQYLLPDAYEAMVCLCENSSNTDVDHYPRKESERIRNCAQNFMDRYNLTGNWDEVDQILLVKEFSRMKESTDELTVAQSNPALLTEIKPWIFALGIWAEMGQETLLLAAAVKQNDQEKFVRKLKHIQVLKQRLEKFEKEVHPASIGTAVIQPFVRSVSNIAVKLFNERNQTNYQVVFDQD